MATTLEYSVKGKGCYGNGCVTASNEDYFIHFTFSEEWAAFPAKTMRVSYPDGRYVDVPFGSDDTAQLPRFNNTDKQVGIGVYTTGDHALVTTRIAYLRIAEAIIDPETAEPEDIYQQILTLVNDGAVKGPQGDAATIEMEKRGHDLYITSDGVMGTQTEVIHEPEKGVDYYTPAEVQELYDQTAAAKAAATAAAGSASVSAASAAEAARTAQEVEIQAGAATAAAQAAATSRDEAATIKTQTEGIKADTAQLKADTAALKSDTQQLKTDTEAIKDATAAIKTEAEGIKTDTEQIKTDAAVIKAETATLRDEAAASAVEAQQIAEGLGDAAAFGAYIVSSASGDVASFDDGAGNVPVKELLVNIEPVQEGEGDPSPDNVRPIKGWTGVTVTANGDAQTIDWATEAGTVYGGTLNATTGELTVTRLLIAAPRVSAVTRHASGVNYWTVSLGKTGLINVLSSQFRSEGFKVAPGNCYLANGGKTLVVVPFQEQQSVTDAAQANAWMSEVAPQFLYDVQEPLVYQLTPIEAKTLLGDNNIWADTGDVAVTYRVDPTIAYNRLKAATSAGEA